ncbi:hypothetical protein NDU88_004131 [Pleurodeles waltl]|uniref:Uncharacterized protein n=1 Tax=Pleurodeles waltl TaxID=8319 RepID=A0AAV7NIW4_PLEWA|nr:hypothetical protein NDU88_004131 [Pleurodeles waltl]
MAGSRNPDQLKEKMGVSGLTDKAIATSSILEVLIDGAVAEDERIVYTPRILCHDVGEQSLVINNGLYIDGVGVLSVGV